MLVTLDKVAKQLAEGLLRHVDDLRAGGRQAPIVRCSLTVGTADTADALVRAATEWAAELLARGFSYALGLDVSRTGRWHVYALVVVPSAAQAPSLMRTWMQLAPAADLKAQKLDEVGAQARTRGSFLSHVRRCTQYLVKAPADPSASTIPLAQRLYLGGAMADALDDLDLGSVQPPQAHAPRTASAPTTARRPRKGPSAAQPGVLRPCRWCGRDLDGMNPRAKVCSGACRVALWRWWASNGTSSGSPTEQPNEQGQNRPTDPPACASAPAWCASAPNSVACGSMARVQPATASKITRPRFCTAMGPGQRPCRARPLKVGTKCFFHAEDAHTVAKRLEAARRGQSAGAVTKRSRPAPHAGPGPAPGAFVLDLDALKTVDDVEGAMRRVAVALTRGEIDPRVAKETSASLAQLHRVLSAKPPAPSASTTPDRAPEAFPHRLSDVAIECARVLGRIPGLELADLHLDVRQGAWSATTPPPDHELRAVLDEYRKRREYAASIAAEPMFDAAPAAGVAPHLLVVAGGKTAARAETAPASNAAK